MSSGEIPGTARLLRTHGALALAGTLGWCVGGGLRAGALFAVMAALGGLYLFATAWTVRLGASGAKAHQWLALLLLFGKLGLLLIVLRGMINRYPSSEGPLLSGVLLHVLSLFVEAVRRGFQRRSP